MVDRNFHRSRDGKMVSPGRVVFPVWVVLDRFQSINIFMPIAGRSCYHVVPNKRPVCTTVSTETASVHGTEMQLKLWHSGGNYSRHNFL